MALSSLTVVGNALRLQGRRQAIVGNAPAGSTVPAEPALVRLRLLVGGGIGGGVLAFVLILNSVGRMVDPPRLEPQTRHTASYAVTLHVNSPLRAGSALVGQVVVQPLSGQLTAGTIVRYRWQMLTMAMGIAGGTLSMPTDRVQLVPLMSGIWQLQVLVQPSHGATEVASFALAIP